MVLALDLLILFLFFSSSTFWVDLRVIGGLKTCVWIVLGGGGVLGEHSLKREKVCTLWRAERSVSPNWSWGLWWVSLTLLFPHSHPLAGGLGVPCGPRVGVLWGEFTWTWHIILTLFRFLIFWAQRVYNSSTIACKALWVFWIGLVVLRRPVKPQNCSFAANETV